MGEIAKGATDLKHVEEGADRSAPIIESDVRLKRNSMDMLKKELTTSSPELRPVEVSDRSAPVVEANIKVKGSPMAALSKEEVTQI